MSSLNAVSRTQAARLAGRILSKPGTYFLIAILFYLFTLQPSLSWGDGVRLQREAISGESFILSELVDRRFAPDPLPFAKLGIAAWDHPLYVILGHTLAKVGTGIFPTTSPLWWVNLVSALFGAGAIALAFKLSLRWTGSVFGAGASAMLLATSHTFWWHAATPEVYTLHAFMLLAALLYFVDFVECNTRRALFSSAFFFGLALANHFLAGLAILPVLVFVVLNFQDMRTRGTFQPRTLAAVLSVFLLGFSPVLVQGARMLRTFSFIELFGPVVGASFFDNMPSISLAESFGRYLVLLLIQFSLAGLVIGLAGLPAAWKSPLKSTRLIPLLYLVYLLFGVFYRVPDQFAFHLTSYVMFSLAAPFGWLRLRERFTGRSRSVLAGLVLLPVTLAPVSYALLAANLPRIGLDEQSFGVPEIGTGVRDGLKFYINPNKHGDDQAYRFGQETLKALPPDALVIAQWYTDTDEYFIFRYFQAVEGLRSDVTIQGWTEVDAFAFEPSLVLKKIRDELPLRPVYLASLSAEFYNSPEILAAYCVIPENNLYRVFPRESMPLPACTDRP